MPGPMTVTCPHCGAGLKLKNDSFVGKRVPCPKCREPFKVEAPENDLSDNFDDDYGAMDEEMEEEEVEERPKSKKGGASASGKAKGGKGKKKSKGGGNGGQIALMVGGAILGIGLLGGLVYGAISLMGRAGGANSWVQWLPDETDTVYRVRVADIVKAPVFAPFTNDPVLKQLMDDPTLLNDGPQGPTDPAQVAFQSLQLKPQDVESITVGLVNAMSSTAPAQARMPGFPGGFNPGMGGGSNIETKQFVAVVRLTRSIDTAVFGQMPPEVMVKQDHSGKTLYSLVKSNDPKVLMYPVDGTTIVLGSEAELKAAVDGNGKAPAHSRFKFVNSSASASMTFAPKDLKKLGSLGMKQYRIAGGATNEVEITDIYGSSTSITFGSDVVIETLTSSSRSMASSLVDSAKKEIEQTKSEFQVNKAGVSTMIPLVPSDRVESLMKHVETMLSGATATNSGGIVTEKMTLSGQFVTDLHLTVTPFMPMLKAQIEAAAKKKAATKPANTMGNSATDVLNYPSTVINAGHSAQTRVEDSAAQHNANIEAAMNEGGSPAAAHGATADPNALMKAAADAQKAAPAPPAGHAAHGATADPNALMKAAADAQQTAPAAPAGHAAHGASADPNALIKAAAAQQNGNPAPAAGHEAHAAPNAGVDPATGNMTKEPAAGGPAAGHGAAANGAAGAGEGAAAGGATKPEPPKSRRRR